jgi:hypothetical protein
MSLSILNISKTSQTPAIGRIAKPASHDNSAATIGRKPSARDGRWERRAIRIRRSERGRLRIET